ncbi:hypothetical protein MRB53_040324 [Persea americana]|nr:hypothetical protein MRB53_040324 [Persea americana]
MPDESFLSGITVLNDTKTRPLLESLHRPKVGAPLLRTYTSHWFARGWIPRLPSGTIPRRELTATTSGPLSDRVAIVTGASSGIGAAVAIALAREGCHVALTARRYAELEKVKQHLCASTPSKVRDQTDRHNFRRAGVMYYTLMSNAHLDDWNQTVDVNCKGLLHCLAHIVPGMLQRGRGHIVAISSDAGRKVFPGLSVYSASKFFVEATLQGLRLETAGKGLRVTSIQPGNTATALLQMSKDAEAVKRYGEPTGARILDPEDVARSIVYALKQPDHVAVNEVLIEPRDEPC